MPLEDSVQAIAGDQDHLHEVQREVVAGEAEGVEREVHQRRIVRVERANCTSASFLHPSSLHFSLNIFTMEQFGSMHYLVSSPALR